MSAYSSHAFAEKVALITDGANDIGRAVAMQLALQGAYVIVGFSGASEENSRALRELQSLGTLANSVEADVSTVEGAKKLVGEVEKMFGRLDLLINTLKFSPQSSFQEISEDIWTKTVDVNLKSVFFVTQAAINLMQARPKPAIVNVAADETDGENAAFTAMQSAVIGLTKSLAKQFAPKFRINCVAVGKSRNSSPEILDAELFRPKTGIDYDDAARVIVYLLSSEAKSLTGQILKIG
ncbi:3-oxoacyl-[acyl-carrier-protein] reductase [soil metagenome]